MARSKHTRRKNIMNGGKLLLGLIAVVLVLLLVFLLSFGKRQNDSEPTNSIPSIGETTADNSSTVSGTSSTVNNENSSTVSNSTASGNTTNTNIDYNLILVNADNLLPTNYSISAKVIANGDKGLNPYSLTFDERAVENLNQLLNDAKKDGVNLYVISAYRAMSKQVSLYEAEVARQKQYNPDYSDAEAKAAAGKNVAIPGSSEHQLGLAVDFNTVETSFENTDEFRWLKENAEKYGFVNRYPKDKTTITGINYEPWHYRYVGVEHAKRMNDAGLCLEEYVKTLN